MQSGKRFNAIAAAALLALTTGFAAQAPAACDNCGTVTDMRTLKKEGEGSGAGAVLGGVVGGVLGHQVGSGRGKDVATVAGAAGGAYGARDASRVRAAACALAEARL